MSRTTVAVLNWFERFLMSSLKTSAKIAGKRLDYRNLSTIFLLYLLAKCSVLAPHHIFKRLAPISGRICRSSAQSVHLRKCFSSNLKKKNRIWSSTQADTEKERVCEVNTDNDPIPFHIR